MIELLSWLGAITGAVGALLIATRTKVSKHGWLGYLLSNVLWIAYAVVMNQQALLAMQLVFTPISALGYYRWYWLQRRRGWGNLGTWHDASVLTARPLRASPLRSSVS